METRLECWVFRFSRASTTFDLTAFCIFSDRKWWRGKIKAEQVQFCSYKTVKEPLREAHASERLKMRCEIATHVMLQVDGFDVAIHRSVQVAVGAQSKRFQDPTWRKIFATKKGTTDCWSQCAMMTTWLVSATQFVLVSCAKSHCACWRHWTLTLVISFVFRLSMTWHLTTFRLRSGFPMKHCVEDKTVVFFRACTAIGRCLVFWHV